MSDSESVVINKSQIWEGSGGRPAASSFSAESADKIEKALFVALGGFLWWRICPESFDAVDWFLWLFLFSEGIVLVFLLVRRPTGQITLRPIDWISALGSSLAGLLVVGSGEPFLPRLGFCLILAGLVLHLAAKLTLRRSFGVVAANRGVKSDGVYAIVRHPMYLGYFLTHVGFLVSAPTIWNALVFTLAWTFMMARMGAEERVLRQSLAYQDYLKKVRYRVLPLVW